MNLEEAKRHLSDIEADLSTRVFVLFATFERDSRPLHVALTDRLRRTCKKGGLWKSKEMLTAIKNAAYGFRQDSSRSRGGSDGVFLIDRDFRPPNQMMRKIFDRFLDRRGSGVTDIATALGVKVTDLQAVRLVSHHLRLLGVLKQSKKEDWLILVDWDKGQS